MSKDESTLSLDKFLPAIPLAGTALAVVFDVGYFWGIGIDFFTFFSLTEHIIFALEALPIAIAIVVVAIIVDALPPNKARKAREQTVDGSLDRAVERIFALKAQLERSRVRLRWVHIGLFVTGGLALWYFAHTGAWRTFVVASAMLLTTLLSIIAPSRWYSSSHASLSFVAVLCTLLIGEFLGAMFATGKTTSYSVMLKSDEARPLNVSRSGERGVLVVDPATTQVEFIKWDDIKQITAKPRQSMFDR